MTLLHTNDFHDRLTADKAAKLAKLRKSVGERGLLLDAGDAVAAGNITYRFGGEPVLDLMSDAGYDAMTVGNREFHFTHRGFAQTLARAHFPILCANLRSSGRSVEGDGPAQSKLPTSPYITSIVEDRCIVVFGLTVPMITERMLARKVSAFIFDDPIKTALQIVPFLREKFRPDLMVALTHIGHARDRQLAETVAGIDLIVGGHSHTRLDAGERVGGTLIVQAYCHAHLYGRVNVEFAGGKPILTGSLEAL